MDDKHYSAGVYKIENRANGKKYIGSSLNVSNRERQHFSLLESNRHSNRYLQSEWNKYGMNRFECSILEYVQMESDLRMREQFWIDYFRSAIRDYGYNIVPTVFPVIRHANESKQKMSISKMGHHVSAETRRLQSVRKRGIKRGPHTEEAKQKIGESNAGYEHVSGSQHWNSALVERDIDEIKARAQCNERIAKIAEDFGVSRSQIYKIINGQAWTNYDGTRVVRRDQRCVLKVEEVVKIKLSLENGMSSIKLASVYGVSIGTISAIKRGRSWKNILPNQNSRV